MCRQNPSGRFHHSGRSAFTLVELLVVISIIGLLAAMLLPALTKAKGRALGINCVSNVKQVSMASKLYTDDCGGHFAPLYVSRASDPNWAAQFPYNSNTFVVQKAGSIWWQDTLRLSKYAPSANVFSCPALQSPATAAAGGSVSANQNLGIGYNYNEMGCIWPNSWNENQVDKPSDCLIYADAAGVTTNSASLSADAWVEVPNTGCSFFRSPSDTFWYPVGDARALPRHQGRVNAGFVDGHAASMKDSDLGWTLSRTDPGALWARNHRGLAYDSN